MIKELQLTSGTKDEEFPSILQTVVFTVENGWCGGEEPRHVSEELRWRCQCHDFRPTDSSRASWPCLGGRRGFPARPDGGSSQFRQILSLNPNPANTTHSIHRLSLLIMSLVARTPVLQRQILRSRAFVPSRGAHSGYKVCVHAKKTQRRSPRRLTLCTAPF